MSLSKNSDPVAIDSWQHNIFFTRCLLSCSNKTDKNIIKKKKLVILAFNSLSINFEDEMRVDLLNRNQALGLTKHFSAL